ncbi:hypothetical protein [Bacillus toyonensis]|uniref:Uncharacterized protein n=1 Tax=Bacillus toyonensis TaxID=155322 RepID=A0A2A8H911_9BACI|nr:hypothetical protein [Bacillus toyonensis]PEP96673.1 hypothetical protein CN585_25305 [Bacillus toyonensis]
MNIKPIETIYKGYRFRSRLEARWAVFFDALGIKWEYEKEGYDLGGLGYYLPDFFLKNIGLRDDNHGLWVEIKPDRPNATEEEKMEKLVMGLKSDGIILIGNPSAGGGWSDRGDYHYQYEYYEYDDGNSVFWDDCMIFTKCYSCGAMKIEYNEHNYMSCPKCGERCDDNHPMINNAMIQARQARFEHGETPLCKF